MKEKAPMSLTRKYDISYLLCGSAWLIGGILGVIPVDAISVKVIRVIAMIIALVCSGFSLFGKAEEPDEMSEDHLYKAKGFTLDATVCAFIFIGVLSLLQDGLAIDFADLYPFVVGGVYLLTGIFFRMEEGV